jgi:DNA topoisomerase-1
MEQKNLVIVESPAKAKTIKKYLGKNFEVLASYGHVRDLVPKEGAVDPKRKFAMRYQILEKNEKHVHAIARALKKSDALYLATDPDREGEAISWHLVELRKELNVLDGKDVHRVVFYEITRNAIREAITQPRAISQDLVNAQQARRALDYLVGFNLSPLLWKKAGLPGASAGRVQSPALRMICEREEEIARFKAREYWTVDADVEKAQQTFPGRLIEYRGEKVEQFTVTSEQQAAEVRAAIEAAAAGKLSVSAIERKQRRRNPAPPFTTSTLQQESARKLGFGAQRTNGPFIKHGAAVQSIDPLHGGADRLIGIVQSHNSLAVVRGKAEQVCSSETREFPFRKPRNRRQGCCPLWHAGKRAATWMQPSWLLVTRLPAASFKIFWMRLRFTHARFFILEFS